MTASEFKNAMDKLVAEFAKENQNMIESSREWLNEFEYHLKDFDSLDEYER